MNVKASDLPRLSCVSKETISRWKTFGHMPKKDEYHPRWVKVLRRVAELLTTKKQPHRIGEAFAKAEAEVTSDIIHEQIRVDTALGFLSGSYVASVDGISVAHRSLP